MIELGALSLPSKVNCNKCMNDGSLIQLKELLATLPWMLEKGKEEMPLNLNYSWNYLGYASFSGCVSYAAM